MSINPRKNKAEIRRKRIIRLTIILCVLAVILTAAVILLRSQVQKEYGSKNQDEILSAQVTSGSIRTTVSGSGTLVSKGLTDVEYPQGLEIEEVLVAEGDSIREGQRLASVRESSVTATMSGIKSQLETLDQKLADAASDSDSTQLKAGVAGRIKAIFASAGDDVTETMLEHGALALLSLDGYMTAEIPAEEYTAGDTVTVETSGGRSYSGSVSQVRDGIATVLVTDNGPEYHDIVTIDGKYTGTLEIHEPLKVVGYAGTVSYVNLSVNTQVYSSSVLMNLKDTAYTSGYNQLLEQRQELEEVLQKVIRIYKEGAILAEQSGVVSSISEEGTSAGLSTSSGTTDYTQSSALLTLNPEKEMTLSITVDETDILSLQVGQSVSITVEAVGDDTYTGTVTGIDTTATSGSGVTYYRATITLPKQTGMMAGMTATASVTIQGVENALLIPEDAVHKTSASSYVYTTYDEETNEMGGMTEVVTGLSNGSYIEITQGLQEGDTVYYTEKEEQRFGTGFMPGNMGGMPSGFSGGGSGGFSGGGSGGFSGGGSGGFSGGGSGGFSGGGSRPSGSGSGGFSGGGFPG